MAQFDIFLKIPGVEGESVDAKHPKEIDLLSFSWGEANNAAIGPSASGAGVGKVAAQDLQIVKHVDKASPRLFIACATGEHFKTAVLVARKAGNNPLEYLKLSFADVIVSAYHITGTADGITTPVENVGLKFGKLEMSYTPQRADGSGDTPIVQKYDFAHHTKG